MSVSDATKQAISKKVGNTASVLVSAVVRLYLASPNPKANRKDPNCILNTWRDLTDSGWKNTHIIGALVLIVDRVLDTYLMRIFDLDTLELRFEYELYEDIDYKELDKQFHAFEMDDCVAGLAFALADEAPKFLSKVNALKPSSKSNAVDALKGKKKTTSTRGFFGGKKKKPELKQQISTVTNVVHTQHIGINIDGTFDLNNISPEWKALFRQAGIKKKDLADPQTAKAIVETIAKTTGMKIVEQPAIVPEYNEEEMKTAGFTPEQMKEYEEYQAALKKYEEDMAAYEAEQEALAKWERDNAQFLAEQAEKERQEAERAESGAGSNKKGPPPVAPPRQNKQNSTLGVKSGETPRRKSIINMIFGGNNNDAAAATEEIPPPPPDDEVMPLSPVDNAAKEREENATRAREAESKRLVEVQLENERKASEEAAKIKEEQERKQREIGEERARLELEHKARLEEIRRQEMEEIESERAKNRALAEQAKKEQEELMAQLKAMKDQHAAAQAEREYAAKLEEIARKEKAEIEAEQKRAKEAAEAAERERQEELQRELAKAKQAAEQAAREQMEILENLRKVQEETANARRALEEEQRKAEELARERAKKKPPPIPARLPDKPPLPALPSAPPRPPPPPSLPPLPKPTAAKAAPALNLAGLGQVKLNKTEEINDKSAPNVTGKMNRAGPANALLGAIEGGAATLKKVGNNPPPPPVGKGKQMPRPSMPELKQMDSNVQTNIMASLVQTMNMRRGALHGDSDEEDGWSD